jgi:hypothetical protein
MLSISLQNSSKSPKSLKFDHSSAKHEKSKSHIKFTMKEIYQEEEKNSKILKYFFNDLSSPKQLSPLKQNYFEKKEKRKISQLFNKNHESTPSLDIEPSIILNIYQEAKELKRSEVKPNVVLLKKEEGDDFLSMLKKTKHEFLSVLNENADLISKLKKKDELNKLNINEEIRKNKKNAKEITIKKRFVKFLNPELSEPNSPLKTESSVWDKKLENSSEKQMTARSLSKPELKSFVKKKLFEKLSFIEKIKQKYEFKTKKEQILACSSTSPKISSKKRGYLNQEGDLEIKDLEYIKKDNKFSKFPSFDKMENSKEKFGKFYNNLIDYYEEECKNKGKFEQNISKQIKHYDERLRDFNKLLLDPSERIGLELDKDIFNFETATSTFKNYKLKRRR